jgi:lipopolysaccharide biosynthesis glycosyltransferase
LHRLSDIGRVLAAAHAAGGNNLSASARALYPFHVSDQGAARDETYLPAACCAVISCRRAGRVTEPIFLVVSNVSDNAVLAARRFLKERRGDAEIIRLPTDLSGYQVDQWISPAAYTCLHLNDTLDGRWHRVLYLDADTRVLAPLWPLLEADLDGRVLGAVDNTRDHNHTERLSMAVDSRYFNSGVLLFDWPAVLSAGLLA